jgi:hypothetical protein
MVEVLYIESHAESLAQVGILCFEIDGLTDPLKMRQSFLFITFAQYYEGIYFFRFQTIKTAMPLYRNKQTKYPVEMPPVEMPQT